jgi:hypothetical protein
MQREYLAWLNKQPNTLNHLFDNLPLEIIKYNIIPFLEYEDRVIVNFLLPPQDRISHPLTQYPKLIANQGKQRKTKFAKNHPDPFWSPVLKSQIVEHPRGMTEEESRRSQITFVQMVTEQFLMDIQLRIGQRKIHQKFKDGIFQREIHHNYTYNIKCRCC